MDLITKTLEKDQMAEAPPSRKSPISSRRTRHVTKVDLGESRRIQAMLACASAAPAPLNENFHGAKISYGEAVERVIPPL